MKKARYWNEKNLAERCKISRSSARYFLSSNPSSLAIAQYTLDNDYLDRKGIAKGNKVYRSRGKAITRCELLKQYDVNPATVTTYLKQWVAKEITWSELHERLQYREDNKQDANRGDWGDLKDTPRPWNLLDIPGANPHTIHDVPEDEAEYFKRLMK